MWKWAPFLRQVKFWFRNRQHQLCFNCGLVIFAIHFAFSKIEGRKKFTPEYYSSAFMLEGLSATELDWSTTDYVYSVRHRKSNTVWWGVTLISQEGDKQSKIITIHSSEIGTQLIRVASTPGQNFELEAGVYLEGWMCIIENNYSTIEHYWSTNVSHFIYLALSVFRIRIEE